MVYHVLNRANAGAQIFETEADYEAFEHVVRQAADRVPMRIVAYCVMPNHWHFILWPREDGDLSEFIRWLSVTHTNRWHANRGTTGKGHLYQGRFKSLPVQSDGHFLTVCRYVERNPLRSGLVRKAEEWRWCSLWRFVRGTAFDKGLISPWPLPRPTNWLELVNQVQDEKSIATIRRCIARGQPFGSETWVETVAESFGLSSTLRRRGRPRARGEGIALGLD